MRCNCFGDEVKAGARRRELRQVDSLANLVEITARLQERGDVVAAPFAQMAVGVVTSHTPLQQISAPSAAQPLTLKLTHDGRGLHTPAKQRPSVLQTLSFDLLTHGPPRHSWQTPPQAE